MLLYNMSIGYAQATKELYKRKDFKKGLGRGGKGIGVLILLKDRRNVQNYFFLSLQISLGKKNFLISRPQDNKKNFLR